MSQLISTILASVMLGANQASREPPAAADRGGTRWLVTQPALGATMEQAEEDTRPSLSRRTRLHCLRWREAANRPTRRGPVHVACRERRSANAGSASPRSPAD